MKVLLILKLAPYFIIAFILMLLLSFVLYSIYFFYRNGIWEYLLFRNKEFNFLQRVDQIFFDKPYLYGASNALNIYLNGQEGKLGAWYYYTVDCYRQGYILYLHGQAGSRASRVRALIAKTISEMGYETLALDYRGYGDSEGKPSETGVVNDAQAALEWLKRRREKYGESLPIIVWGHSLGAAIALSLTAREQNQETIKGLIIESPFRSVYNQISQRKNKILRKILCLYDYSEKRGKSSFDNEETIKDIRCQMLIMHSENDGIVSHNDSLELYNGLPLEIKTKTVYVLFDERFGHSYIYKAKCLQNYVESMMLNIQGQ